MIKNFLAAVALTLLTTAIALAQCSCSSCSGSGGDETAGCDSSDKWSNEFFDCNRPPIVDPQICDPCCRKPYFSMSGGYSSVENIGTSFSLGTTLNVIDDGTTLIDPGPPPVFSQFVAETTDVVRQHGVNMADGYGVGGTIGYRVHPSFRLEADFAYRENQVDSGFVTDTTTITRFDNAGLTSGTIISDTSTSTVVNATGTIQSYSGMLNAIYDVSPRRLRCFNLYFGGGIGLANVNGEVFSAANNFRIDSTSFAYQFIGGGNVPLTHRAEFFTEYKYLGAENLTIDDATTGGPFGRTGIDMHNVFVGIRLYPNR